MNNICNNIKSIKTIINSYKYDRKIDIVAITKTFSWVSVLEALKCGINNIGENKIQEALPKFNKLGVHLQGVTKHFVGNLQSNKIKKIVKNFDLIHSLDDIKLANKIDSYAKIENKIQQCLIEIKFFENNNRSGIYINKVLDFYKKCLMMKNIIIRGIMIISPYINNPTLSRHCFKITFGLFKDIKKKYSKEIDFNILSMGMSNDYKIAIEEGANLLRIGSAIFGER
ncbi:MAG: YggS family pyridoxal phosphate-dependent enzyme [Endomicrobium sp.]|jgi:pyridoxal phosphate enzyme (YggS family)|nr:YggS family pyridoxal phosphate-dependent enzyme [Endomicrobium sp.]